MCSQLCIGIVQIVDTLMVGHLGTVELAAVSFASSVFAIGNVFSMGVVLGLTPLVGQSFVRGEHAVCARLFQNAFLLALLASVAVCSALFVVAAALGVRCGSCFHAVWNQEREKAGLAMPMTEDTSGAVRVGIEAMKRIIASDKAK